MVLKLILSVPFLLAVITPQTVAPPPIKMGLWEATITTGAGAGVKTRSCLTKESYQEAFAKMPPGCTVSHQMRTSQSLNADISCTFPNGGSSTGHIDVEFSDAENVRTTVNMTVSMQGRTIPMAVKTESHFVSADCGDIAPGATKEVQ